MYALIYTLIWHTREHLKDTELENAQTGTLREKIVKIASFVEETYRWVVITVSKATPYLKF